VSAEYRQESGIAVARFLHAVGVAVCLSASLRAEEPADDRARFETTCLPCHAPELFRDTPQSAKAWEVTVARMQRYASFTDEEGELIVVYLADGQFLADFFPAAAQTGSAAAVPVGQQRFLSGQVLARVARVCAIGAMGCLVLLALTGLARRHLTRRFLPIHATLAVLFTVSAAVHTAICLARYGAPPVLWLGFGLVALVGLAAANFSGLTRLTLRGRFRPIHAAAGFVCLVFSVLHWIWALRF